MSKFWEMFAESVITQSLITMGVIGVWLYMQVAQLPVPAELNNIVGLVVGFFFGGKYALAMKNASTQAAVAVTRAGRPDEF